MNYSLYHGMSMRPLFQEADLLEIIPIGSRELRRGDIIAFLPSANEGQLVVHRIVKIAPDGIMTRGDNNSGADSVLVDHNLVLGRVHALHRDGKRKTLLRGAFALWLTAVRRRLRALSLRGKLLALLRSLYHFSARRSSLVARFLPISLKPRVVIFQSNGRPLLRLFLGNQLVGHYHLYQKRWNIRRPFRLLIDERALPTAYQLEHAYTSGD